MCDLLIVYPLDTTTDFLLPVVNCLESIEQFTTEIIRTEPTEESYLETLLRIESCALEVPILFLGHGHSRMLYGGCFKNHARIPLITLRHEKYLLKKRTFLLLACRSSDFIREIEDLSFAIGFGDLPTDMEDIMAEREFDNQKYQGIEKETVDEYRKLLVLIVGNSICESIIKTRSFDGFYMSFKLRVNKAISNSLLSSRSDKVFLCELLYELRAEVFQIDNRISLS